MRPGEEGPWKKVGKQRSGCRYPLSLPVHGLLCKLRSKCFSFVSWEWCGRWGEGIGSLVRGIYLGLFWLGLCYCYELQQDVEALTDPL